MMYVIALLLLFVVALYLNFKRSVKHKHHFIQEPMEKIIHQTWKSRDLTSRQQKEVENTKILKVFSRIGNIDFGTITICLVSLRKNFLKCSKCGIH